MYKLSDVMHENGRYWVLKLPKDKGYQVYEAGITHSTLKDTIGYPGEMGLNRAIEKCDRRAADDQISNHVPTRKKSPSPM